MSFDPYPDLSEPVLLSDGDGEDPTASMERPELSDADTRLLDALSQRQPPVVRAVEDEPRRPRVAEEQRAPVRPTTARPSLAPVFQEPTA